MTTPTELAVYETFEEVFLRRSTFDELIADLRVFSQQSVLWVCAAIVTGMQLWNRPNLQPFDIYQRFLSLFFDGALRARFIVGYWSTDPRRFLFHRRQILLISKLAILHCPGHGVDARFSAERFGPILLKANDHLHYGSTIGISPFLNTFLEERLDGQLLPIEVRPLFCTDIETLEFASGFFGASTLPQVLEHWFVTNPSLTTPLSAIDFGRFVWREDGWLRAEWNSVYKSMIKILFPDKNPEAALAEAVKRAESHS